MLIGTEEKKLAYDYSGISFDKLEEVDCISYKILVRDAFLYKLKQSEEGREILQSSWILQQTSPDKKSLRDKFNK